MAKSKGKKVEQPLWHANFRVVDTLPDTKLIRTGFILNFLAVFIAVGLLSYAGLREYKTYDLSIDIDELNSNIEINSSENKKRLHLNTQFEMLSNKLKELDRFRSSNPFSPPDLILALSEVRAHEIVLSNVDFRDVEIRKGRTITIKNRISLVGKVTGTSEGATQTVYDYIQRLESLEMFSGHIEKINLDSLLRDEESEIFDFSILIELNMKKS